MTHEKLAARSRQQWAERIRATVATAAEAIVAVGRELVAAREALDYGDFLDMVTKDLGRSTRWAEMFMSIARNEGLAKHVSALPADTLALYRLSRLPADVIDESVRAGVVKPTMGRTGALELAQAWRVETEGTYKVPEPRSFVVSYSEPLRMTDDELLRRRRRDVENVTNYADGWWADADLTDVLAAADRDPLIWAISDREGFISAMEDYRAAVATVKDAASRLVDVWPLGTPGR